jgi:hypothetical protein
MKTKPILVSLFAAHCMAMSASADLVLTQETLVGEAKSTTKMMIKGNKVRTDASTSASMIMDTESGEMTTLVHEQKMVMTQNNKALQAAAGAKPEAVESPKITATGKMEKIDGYNCEIYTSELKGMVITMWIAKDYPNFAKLQEALKPMLKMSNTKPSEIPGMMIKSTFTQSGLNFTTKLVSIEEKELSEDLFKAPADYKAPGA